MIRIYAGVPENDNVITVDSCTTSVNAVFKQVSVSTSGGVVQHNGKNVGTNDMNKTLDEIGVNQDDTLYFVKKLANAE